MQGELESRHDAEVGAAATDGPEQVGFVEFTDMVRRAVRGGDVGGDEVVDRHAVLARQPAEAAAQSEASDTRRGVDPHGGGKTVVLSRGIEYPERRASGDPCPPPRGVDGYVPHAREIDDQAAVDERMASNVVPAAANRDVEIVIAREADGVRDVVGAGAAYDQRRPSIDHGVPDRARRIVVCIASSNDVARHHTLQRTGVDQRGRLLRRHTGRCWHEGEAASMAATPAFLPEASKPCVACRPAGPGRFDGSVKNHGVRAIAARPMPRQDG
jgi:hypothetical protein